MTNLHDHDRLSDLLTRADAAASAPPTVAPADLAARVRLTHARRRRRTRTMATAAAMTAIAAVILTVARHPPGIGSPIAHDTTAPPPATHPATDHAGAPTADVARLRAEVAALARQAEQHERVIAALLADEPPLVPAYSRAPRPARHAPDPLATIRAQQDLAALALLRQADRIERELGRPATATATYARVIELFPQTPSAVVARQRLAEIKG